MQSIKICPSKAYLTRDTQSTSAMDPFVKLILGKQKYRTKTIPYGGTKVSWDQTFTVNTQEDNIMTIEVYDEDNVVNDLVGSAKIDLTPYFKSKQLTQKYVSIKYQKIPAGKVLLVISPANFRPQSQNRINPTQFKLYTAEDILKATINKFTQKDSPDRQIRKQRKQKNVKLGGGYIDSSPNNGLKVNRIDRPTSYSNSINIKYENHGDDNHPYYKPPVVDYRQNYLHTPSKYENTEKFRHTEYMGGPAPNIASTPQQNHNRQSTNNSKYSSGGSKIKSGQKGLTLSSKAGSKIGGSNQ